jgi:hypothetical protein
LKNKYYIVKFRLNNKDSYLIWCTNDIDKVLTTTNGKILHFPNKQSLLAYAANNKITIVPEEPAFYNLDSVSEWIKTGNTKNVNCNKLNNAWNLFQDISLSVNVAFDSKKEITDTVYEKLFWGCNLPVVTPEGKSYVPIWSQKEIKILKNILSVGIKLFKESLEIT